MKLRCPSLSCSKPHKENPISGLLIRNGNYVRKSDSKKIAKYYCRSCGSYFSRATLSPNYFQKNRRINAPLYELLCSGVSQRRAARILKVNPKTVARRSRFLAGRARLRNERELRYFRVRPLSTVQFDDLETSEHTKCKPLSVALAVDPKTRKILDFQVSQMPAKGRLARISVRKYGYRKDERAAGWNALFANLKDYVAPHACFVSDENPHYPKHLFRHYPACEHISVPGGRAAITGQGELKKKKFDPLFSLNHTCAMLRANLNRLFRRTWCTTKTRQGLIDHLSLYVCYHNTRLTPSSEG